MSHHHAPNDVPLIEPRSLEPARGVRAAVRKIISVLLTNPYSADAANKMEYLADSKYAEFSSGKRTGRRAVPLIPATDRDEIFGGRSKSVYSEAPSARAAAARC